MWWFSRRPINCGLPQSGTRSSNIAPTVSKTVSVRFRFQACEVKNPVRKNHCSSTGFAPGPFDEPTYTTLARAGAPSIRPTALRRFHASIDACLFSATVRLASILHDLLLASALIDRPVRSIVRPGPQELPVAQKRSTSNCLRGAPRDWGRVKISHPKIESENLQNPTQPLPH